MIDIRSLSACVCMCTCTCMFVCCRFSLGNGNYYKIIWCLLVDITHVNNVLNICSPLHILKVYSNWPQTIHQYLRYWKINCLVDIIKTKKYVYLILQSANWYCFWAVILQYFCNKWASEKRASCNVLAACPVSNMFTIYTPKSRCNQPMSASLPCKTCCK